MTEAQIQLQNALTTTFLANLTFLSEYDNKLYHRVDELSRMIENGTYQEKYALDFIMEDGDFDIYDIVNDKYLYNRTPKKKNNEFIRKVQFDEKESIFTLETIYTTKILNQDKIIDKFNMEHLGESNFLTQRDIYSYSSNLNDFLEDSKKRLKRIDKFIFLGTLLGRHIPKIAEKIDAQIYLVCERNLEIFRLSLFCVDYTILAKNKGVVFSIMDSTLDEEKNINTFLSVSPLENYILKFSTTGVNISEYIDRILSTFLTIKPTSYDYNRYLYTYINRSTNILSNPYKVLLFNKIKDNFDYFKDLKVLFLAAGPSLDENIEWIKENQNKFFIVAIGAVYKKLLSKNIRIDIIITLDEQEFLNRTQFDDETVKKIDRNTIIFASMITNKKVLEKFNKENLFFYETFIPFYNNNLAFSGFSIGELSIELLLNLNIKELYLIGLDFALNQSTGSTHAQTSSSGLNKSFKLEHDQEKKEFGLRKGLIKVKGNFQSEVFTTGLFYTSIKYLEERLISNNYKANIYNLSTQGAYIENTIPKRIKDIEVENFKEINTSENKIINLLNTNSSENLDNNSKQRIYKEIEFLENILRNEFEIFKKSEYTTYNDFYKSTISFLSSITDFEFLSSSISRILINYAQIVLPYLSYHFNDIKLKNETKKIKKINDILLTQIYTIINDYINCLKRLN